MTNDRKKIKRDKAALKRVSCFALALGLVLLPAFSFPGTLGAFADNSQPLGISNVATDQAFSDALSDPQIGTIHISGNIDATAINWNAAQAGVGKAITGAGYALTLPAVLSSGGPLTFENITLVRPNVNGTVIFANSQPFRFGPGVHIPDPFITAMFGGANSANSGSTEITIESGSVSAIFAGSNNGIINGSANVTVHSGATVGGIYASYTGATVTGQKLLTLKGFAGQGGGYTSYFPVSSGFDEITLDNCRVVMASWPAWLDAGRISVQRNSGIWFNGHVSPLSRINGDNAGLVITAGSVVTLPGFADSFTGKFSLSLSAGAPGDTSVLIKNGALFAASFEISDTYHKAVSGNDLSVHSVALNRIELTPPAKTLYFLGEALDTTGGLVKAFYDPAALNLRVDVPLDPGMVSGYNGLLPGRQELTVGYGGKTASYTVWVADPYISRLSLYTLPKTSYYIDESLDISRGNIEITYKNGHVSVLPFTDPSVTVTGFDSSTSGSILLSVYHNGRLAGTYWVRIGGYPPGYFDYVNEVDIWGLYYGDKIEVGDVFTLTPSYPGGRWTWDDDYLEADIDRYDTSASFTAIKPGLTRVAYRVGSARATETVRITGTVDELPVDMGIIEPPYEPGVPLNSTPTQSTAPIPPPVGNVTSSQSPSSSQSSQASSASSSKPAPQSKAEPESAVSAVQEPEPPYNGEDAVQTQGHPFTVTSLDGITVALVGITSASLLMLVAGMWIWRYARKREAN